MSSTGQARKQRDKGTQHIRASLKKYRKWFVIGPFFKLLEAVLELIIPTLMAGLIDRGVTDGDSAYIVRMIPLMIGLAVFGYLSALVCQYVASLTSQGFGTELRNRLFAHILHLSKSDADRFGTPTLVNRVTGDTSILQQAVAMVIRLAVRAPFICIGSLVMAAMLNLKLTVIILLSLPLLAGAVWLISKAAVPRYGKVQKNIDNISRISRENFSGVRVIRAFGRERKEHERFGEECDSYTRSVTAVNRIATLLGPVTTLIMNVAVIAVLYFGGRLAGSGDMTGGQIVAFINYITMMVTALLVVANLITLFSKAAASLARTKEIFNVPEAPEFAEAGNGTTEISGDGLQNASGDNAVPPAVEFAGASLRYGNDETLPEAVKGADFAIRSGETLGIVGLTGSGKTSLVSLLTGLYAPTSGEVRVFGKKIGEWNVKELHDTVRIAAQHSVLFSGTVRENIQAGNADVTDEQIVEALKTAQAWDFVADKGGLDAKVERGGVNFSGGQKQRLSVARAVCGNPRVLILDDSLSALDNVTASNLLSAIRKTEIKTLIIVSQRAGSVRRADRILVLDDGETAAIGNHAELLAACPLYADICRLSEVSSDD